jgi:hypothetical protein
MEPGPIAPTHSSPVAPTAAPPVFTPGRTRSTSAATTPALTACSPPRPAPYAGNYPRATAARPGGVLGTVKGFSITSELKQFPGPAPNGSELLGEVAQYESIFRLCSLRGPAGIVVALAEQIG